MPVLTSSFNAQTDEAKANRAAWQGLIEDLQHQRRIAAQGGPERARAANYCRVIV